MYLTLTRKAPDKVCEILTSRHSLYLSFSLLFYVISTATLKFPPWFPAFLNWFPTFFAFPPSFHSFWRWFPATALLSHSSHSYPCSLHFPHSAPQFSILTFTDSLLSFVIFKDLFIENSQKRTLLVQKRTLSITIT